MRIVSKTDFLKLPAGTLYSIYESFGDCKGLYLKTGNTIGDTDWYYDDLTNCVDCNDTGEFADTMLAAEADQNYTFRLDPECGQRYGMYDDEARFAVYDLVDVTRLLNKMSVIASNYFANGTISFTAKLSTSPESEAIEADLRVKYQKMMEAPRNPKIEG